MSKSRKICFLADRHDLHDDRIYWKMAVPLIKNGFEVHYLLIGDKAEMGTTKEGIHYKIFKLKTFSKNRFYNFLLKRLNPENNYKSMLREAEAIEADIYHFHDLWINMIGIKLKRLPHKPVVFYDAREPYAEDYLSYIKTSFPFVVQLFAAWVDRWEKNRAKNYDLVIANEQTVRENFAKVIGEGRAVVLYNYTDSIQDIEHVPYNKKVYDLVYCGAITTLRGAFEILKAVKLMKIANPEIKCLFLGSYYPVELKDELQAFIDKNDLGNQVELMDAVPYKEVGRYYELSKIGLVLLQRVKTFEISMPIKIFEYMAFGLPIIGSDFGHMKDYIEKENCGINVNPNDSKAIADAALKMLKDKDLYELYSENGKRASHNKYRWELEFEKLLRFYKNALDER